MKVVESRWKFVAVPAIILVLGIVMYIVHGFNFDVEFMGGTRMEINLKQEFDNDEVAQLIQDATGANTKVQHGKDKDGNDVAIVKMQATEDDNAAKGSAIAALNDKYKQTDENGNVTEITEHGNVVSASTASASFGKEMQKSALLYTLIAILCILVYIAIRFEFKSAVMAVIALAINVLIMAAVYSITYIPINTTFIAAMLTVVGYSINNTIVIFDRIRENMKGRRKNTSVTEIVNESVKETMGRTINSTITTLITIVLIYFLGVSAIKEFALPLIVGIIAGAYTSIFIASSFWAIWKESELKARAAAAAERRATKKK